MSERTLTDVFQEHLGISGRDLSWETQNFLRDINEVDPYFFAPKDLDWLSGLSKALLKLDQSVKCQHTDAAQDVLFRHVIYGPHIEKSDVSSSDDFAERIQAAPSELDVYIQEQGLDAAKVLHGIIDHVEAIRAAIRSASKEIENSKRIYNGFNQTNMLGVKIVEAALMVWEQVYEKEQRLKSLNPTSPFGKFLTDLFEVCDPEHQPRSSVDAWNKLRRQQSAEL